MDPRRLEDKLEKIDLRLNSIDITLTRQNVTLEEHVKRTNLLEKKIEPVERHVAMINGGLKVLGFGTVVFEILKIIGIFK